MTGGGVGRSGTLDRPAALICSEVSPPTSPSRPSTFQSRPRYHITSPISLHLLSRCHVPVTCLTASSPRHVPVTSPSLADDGGGLPRPGYFSCMLWSHPRCAPITPRMSPGGHVPARPPPPGPRSSPAPSSRAPRRASLVASHVPRAARRREFSPSTSPSRPCHVPATSPICPCHVPVARRPVPVASPLIRSRPAAGDGGALVPRRPGRGPGAGRRVAAGDSDEA